MYGEGIVIGLKKKETKYRRIIKKLLNHEKLEEGDKEFLKKEGLQV